MARHRAILGAATLLSLASACSGGDGASKGTRDLALLSECSGNYSCVLTAIERSDPGHASFDDHLTVSNGVCADSIFELFPHGEVLFDPTLQQPLGTWTGNRSEFSACFSDSKLGCVQCYALDPPSQPASSASGHCTGTAADCHGAGACDGQLGCYTEISVAGSAYDTCAGTATECKDIATQDHYNEQRGCSWL